MNIKFFITICLAVALSACGGKTIVKETTKVIAPPDNMLLDVDVTQPPNVSEYLALKQEERELMLAKYVGDLLDDAFTCNANMAGLRKWKKDTIIAVDKVK